MNYSASLPPELIYQIISEIYSSEKPLCEFRACTAISQIWHDVGRPFLFRDINLVTHHVYMQDQDKQTPRRMEALVELAHIYSAHRGDSSASFDPFSQVHTLSIGGACITASTFPRLVDLLVHTRGAELLIDARPPNLYAVDKLWDLLDQTQREALCKLLRRQTALSFIHGKLPMAIWCISSSLTSLDLMGLDYEDTEAVPVFPSRFHDRDEDPSVLYPPLTHIVLRGDTIPVLLKEHPGLLKRLESVNMEIYSYQIPSARCIFQATQSTLKSARIDLNCRGDFRDPSSGWAPLILSEFSGKTLHVEFIFDIGRTETVELFLRDTFASLPLQTLSELSLEVCVGFTAYPSDPHRTLWPTFLPVFLRELDRAFLPYVRDSQVTNERSNSDSLADHYQSGNRELALRRLNVAFRGFGCDYRPGCQFPRGGIDIDSPDSNAPLMPAISHLMSSGVLQFKAVFYISQRKYPVRIDVGVGPSIHEAGETVLARAHVPATGEICHCLGLPRIDYARRIQRYLAAKSGII